MRAGLLTKPNANLPPGVITIGVHNVKDWSKTQNLEILNSRLYVILKAAAETFGLISRMNDLGWHMSGEVWGDASAALDIINRRGFGKTKHIDVGLLWIQQIAAQKRLNFNKILDKMNPADLYTKFLGETNIINHSDNIAYQFAEKRTNETSTLH